MRRPFEAMIEALVDGRSTQAWPVDDRGLAYGDGVFETIRFVDGRAPLWSLHLRRLLRSCRRLGILAPASHILASETVRIAKGGNCIVKVIVTRRGGRGYAAVRDAPARRLVLRLPAPDDTTIDYESGVRLRWCRLRLGSQPMLAGLKHLNRLEQVLARSEWQDPRIHDGLLCDGDGRVICATAANVFAVRGGTLLTPRIDHCGVAGVARAWAIARARRWLPVREADLEPRDLDAAEEVFLTNAVRGIVPVRAIGSTSYAIGPATQRLGYTLAGLGIGRSPILLSA